jgi:hypothetical protein
MSDVDTWCDDQAFRCEEIRISSDSVAVDWADGDNTIGCCRVPLPPWFVAGGIAGLGEKEPDGGGDAYGNAGDGVLNV